MQIEQFPRPRNDSRVGYRLNLAGASGNGSPRDALGRAREHGASWVTLSTSSEHSLTGETIRTATELDLEPVIWIDARPAGAVDLSEFASLCRRYARAGVNYLCIFDRPNTARLWSYEEWRRPGLPERFATLLMPLLETTHANGLCPVVGPLAPDGQYWDLTFLAQLLAALGRESRRGWLDRLALGVVDVSGRWGLGVEDDEVSDRSRPVPYARAGTMSRSALSTSRWYDALAQEHLGRLLPLISLDASPRSDAVDLERRGQHQPVADERQNDVRELILRGALPGYRLNVSFGTLPEDGSEVDDGSPAVAPSVAQTDPGAVYDSNRSQGSTTIDHYVLLCPGESSDRERWSLTGLMGAILPYVGRFRPAIGFSIDEAASAAKVTIVGPDPEQLRQVEQQLNAVGHSAEAIPADSVADLKRIMVELASRKARLIRLPEE